ACGAARTDRGTRLWRGNFGRRPNADLRTLLSGRLRGKHEHPGRRAWPDCGPPHRARARRRGARGKRAGPGKHVPLNVAGMAKLLIVEEEPSILRGLADQFRREGYEVLAEADGDGGYAAIAREAPDIILLDLMLPGMSGYEICRRLRSAGNQTPVLMLTAR